MNRLLLALPITLAAACATNDTCVEGFGRSASALDRMRRGGWDANGRELTGTADGDRVFSGLEIAGAVLDGEHMVLSSGAVLIGSDLSVVDGVGRTRAARITAVERDEAGVRYELMLGGEAACEDGAGVFVPGRWDSAGRYTAEGITFACPRGVIAKCLRWGFAPWSAGQDLLEACVRATRADYCGDGTAYTLDGTPIDLYDRTGGASAPGALFEAGWNAAGAVCVSRPRWDAYSLDGEERLPSCWADKPICGDAESAAKLGATVFTGSRSQALTVCE